MTGDFRSSGPFSQATASLRNVTDGSGLLIVYLIVLFVVPARLIVLALGTLGSPATLISLVISFWWFWLSVRRGVAGASWRRNVVRLAGLVLITVSLLVYANAAAQPRPPAELTTADSAVLRFIALIVLVLVVVDTIRTPQSFRRILDAIVISGAMLCTLGLAQALTQNLFVDNIVIPGLTNSSMYDPLVSRSGRIRPVGTATHPIEFGAVMAMMLPLVLARARIAVKRRRFWVSIALIVGLCILLSLSRTAVIGSIVGTAVLTLGWNRRERMAAVLGAAGLVLVSALAFPGVIGTLRGLFLHIGGDSSVTSRTDSYGVAFEFIRTSPFLGRGYGTFTPQYWILDNFYLLFTIETGILGIVAFVALVASAVIGGWKASRAAPTPALAELMRGVVGAACAGATTLAFFDAFSFPQTAGVFVLAVGLCGASVAMIHDPPPLEPPSPLRTPPAGLA